MPEAMSERDGVLGPGGAGCALVIHLTVKAPALEDALGRVKPQAFDRAVILPLMNGLEHVETIRARSPGRCRVS
jgi:ketopantoate reductase